MKKNSEILGLPVISITEGSELGRVKCLVINSLKGAVVAMIIEDDHWYKVGAKLVPFTAIIGVGDNAVTIENSSSVVSIADNHDIEKLLDANVKIIGAKVLTKRGSFQGCVTEYSLDQSGIIGSCQIEGPTGEIAQIQGQRILTFGKGIIIISDDESSVTSRLSVGLSPVITPIIAQPVDDVTLAVVERSDNSVKKFEDKQRTYLLGKKVTRRIETDNGVLIIEKGEEITKEVIEKAQHAGKFVELSMNI